MNHILEEKLNRDSVTYGQAEIDWLLENIGNENSEIRDVLVFESLANRFLNHYFRWHNSNILHKFRWKPMVNFLILNRVGKPA